MLQSIDVDTMLMSMFVSYEFKMSWFDNRLQYLNLKYLSSLNVLPLSIIEEIWSPSVSFANTKGSIIITYLLRFIYNFDIIFLYFL